MNTEQSQIQNKEQQLYSSKLNPSIQGFTSKNSHQIQSATFQNQNSQSISNEKHENLNESANTLNTLTLESAQDNQVFQEDIQFYEVPQTENKRKKYGNMLIFCESKRFLLSLGPNYLFFYFAYLCFTLATIFLVGLVNANLVNQNFKIFNFTFCWLQNLSYLLVALSNPGVVLPQTAITLEVNQLKNKRFCQTCSAVQQRKTYHCRQCDVCIKDYDHHCPWTSKCIGGGNLKRFYFFVIMTPFYIFYYMVVFMICMANNVVENSHNEVLRKEAIKF